MAEISEESAVQAGPGARRVALAGGKIRREEGSTLPQKDIARLPATDQQIKRSGHVSTELPSAANR